MSHYIKKCKECQTVMGQCRCPAENKFVEWAVCEKCSQKTDRVQEARDRIVLSFGGEGYTSLEEVEAELDALIAAVRTERVEVTDAMVEALAKRLAAEAYVDMRHRDLLPVEPFNWDVMLTDFQREQWSGRARLHLTAALEEL